MRGDAAPGLASRSGGYGRGRRLTAFRRTRALTDSPISASSAAVCAAMVRMSLPVEDSEGSARGGVGGTPPGWAGWGRGSARGADALRCAPPVSRLVAVGSRRAADALRPVRARGAVVAPVRFPAPDEPLPLEEPPFSVVPGAEDADRFAGAGEARLSLRRCGRLCGSAPSTSEGRSSVNRPQSWRKRLPGSAGNALLAKSEQDLKPPRRLRVYV